MFIYKTFIIFIPTTLNGQYYAEILEKYCPFKVTKYLDIIKPPNIKSIFTDTININNTENCKNRSFIYKNCYEQLMSYMQ